jgi:hypothetical protein
MRTMAFRVLPEINLAVNSSQDPSDDEWNAYIAAVTAKIEGGADVTKMRTLVFSDGGGPNAAQRALINEGLAGRPTRVALVSSSLAVRGVTTALRWFNPQIKSFSPSDVTSAFRFLDLGPADYPWVWKEVQSLARELDVPQLRSVTVGMEVAPGKPRK